MLVPGEGEHVDDGVEGGGEEHEQPQLLPHAQPTGQPLRKARVLRASGKQRIKSHVSLLEIGISV